MKQNCEQFKMAISARLDGETPDTLSIAELDAHLHECQQCRSFQKDLNKFRKVTLAQIETTRPLRGCPKVTSQDSNNLFEPVMTFLQQPKFWLGSLSLAIIILIAVFAGSSNTAISQSWVLKSSSHVSLLNGSVKLQAKANGVLVSPAGRLAIWSGPASLHLNPDKSLVLNSGRCCFQWFPEKSSRDHRPLTLKAGKATFTITGTTWRLAHGPNNVTLAVSEGVIEVSAGNSKVKVEALHQVKISPQGTIGTQTAFNPMADPDFQRGMAMTVGER